MSLSLSTSSEHCGQPGPVGQVSVSSPSEMLVQPGSVGKPGNPSPSASTASLQAAVWQVSAPAGPLHAKPVGHDSTPAATIGSLQAAPAVSWPLMFSE